MGELQRLCSFTPALPGWMATKTASLVLFMRVVQRQPCWLQLGDQRGPLPLCLRKHDSQPTILVSSSLAGTRWAL